MYNFNGGGYMVKAQLEIGVETLLFNLSRVFHERILGIGYVYVYIYVFMYVYNVCIYTLRLFLENYVANIYARVQQCGRPRYILPPGPKLTVKKLH